MCFAKYDKELYAQIIEELDNTKWSGDDESHNLAPRFYPVKKKSIIIDIRQFGKPFGIRQNKNKTWTVYAKDKNHDISWNYATLSRALARFKIMVNNSGYYSRRAEKNSIKVYNEVKQLLKKTSVLIGQQIEYYGFERGRIGIITKERKYISYFCKVGTNDCPFGEWRFLEERTSFSGTGIDNLHPVFGTITHCYIITDSFNKRYRGFHYELDNGQSLSLYRRYEEFGYPIVFKKDATKEYYERIGLSLELIV